jgi:hypothetical protein
MNVSAWVAFNTILNSVVYCYMAYRIGVPAVYEIPWPLVISPYLIKVLRP